MPQKFEGLRGMEDILPGEVEKWQWLEDKARIFLESRGFKEIRTPLLEPTELFTRSVGEASDIVHKEMFSFEDRGGRNVSLRPEMTASVARAVIEHGLLTQAKSLRLYYLGPMFRAERPQAGRKRQFHQIGIEMVNEPGLAADFEVLTLLYGFLKFVGLQKISLRLNDLGDATSQAKMADRLRDYFSKHKAELCEDCRFRLEKNVLRIFDCKVESCQPVIQKAPWEEIAPLGSDFQKLAAELKAHKIPFEIRRRLVRGLDYYNGIVFEVAAEGLGAQDAVAGGGRYDRLYEALGGEPTPCTGFSIGIERLLIALGKQMGWAGTIQNRKIYLAPLDAACAVQGLCEEKALELRTRGFRIETLKGETSLSKHLKKANQLGLRYVLIIGSEEIQKGKWTLKDMDEKRQTEIDVGDLAAELEKVVAS